MIKKEPGTCTLNFEFNIAQYGNAVIQKTCQITNLLTLSLLGFKCKQRYLRQKTQNTMCRQVRKLINQQRNITNAGTWALTKRFDSYEHEVNNTFSPVFTVERGTFFFFFFKLVLHDQRKQKNGCGNYACGDWLGTHYYRPLCIVKIIGGLCWAWSDEPITNNMRRFLFSAAKMPQPHTLQASAAHWLQTGHGLSFQQYNYGFSVFSWFNWHNLFTKSAS